MKFRAENKCSRIIKTKEPMLFDTIRDHVLQDLLTNLPATLPYHDYAHTIDVVRAAQEYGTAAGLDQASMDMLLAASLLHETGILKGYIGHEEESVAYAKRILPVYGYSDAQINVIVQLILETEISRKPTSLLSEILRDADLDYLGRPDYFAIAHKLRLEWIHLNNYPKSLKVWYLEQLNFLQKHKYYTIWATQSRSQGLEDNIKLIHELISLS
jgi:hypothetical protein